MKVEGGRDGYTPPLPHADETCELVLSSARQTSGTGGSRTAS
jgi:hypothetical protein